MQLLDSNAPTELQRHADDVRRRLAAAIPNPKVELDFTTPWQLLVATILAAQSTDKKINEVTPVLFARYPGPKELAEADLEEVMVIVKPTGFFREKAKRIVGAAQAVHERFGGTVPKTLQRIMTLPGVARKTGNVVIGSAYGIATGMVVDTHVSRVAARLELTTATDPVAIEEELITLFPKRSWVKASHQLVLHGRYVCQAKKPRCEMCPLNEICGSRRAPPRVRGWKRRAEWERALVESKGATDSAQAG
ncbi:MAG: endonuclease III [Sandaracinaceae bacterium]